MKSLFDANWYEKCQYKFEYVNREVKELKNKEKLDIYDEIKLNTLLNVLKSPMDYAYLELVKTIGKINIDETSKNKLSIPFRPQKYTDGDFKKRIICKVGCVNKEIFKIFNKLFEDKTYEIFNNMQNDEKHNHINTHYIEVSHKTEFSFYNDSVSEIDSITGEEDQNVVKMSKGSSNLQEHYYEENYYFYYKDKKVGEVFSFLNKVENMAKEFVEGIKVYIDTSNKTPE
ncbi:hypothetical protein [Staphylococcus hyicus]|uniref:Uncharacterized protein n=1 Tax=Staphylococcus hyicus TaxID=1284 RepID=A0ACD5FLN1_STAHY|nr:hypothetical protein [Staphylococcus hyicus]MDP4447527.1 hypothetical protein [Staphylococcus hyicus]MDP4460435.1 hypothetical protein [Staphylococcus hyicus]MDP4463449.1 hypothetical protein [Staphylococcus hyicus]